MKKIFFLLFFLLPILLTAQRRILDTISGPHKREIAASPAMLLRLIGVVPQYQPFFMEYKHLMGKRYLRMRVETYSEQNRDGEFGELVKKDSLLIIDNTIVGKTGGFLRIGMERQRLLKVNPKYRLRTGVDVLVGFQSQNKTGSYAVIDIKENIITSKDYSRKDFEGEKYFTTGLAAFAGLDYRITSQVYLGLNVDYNFLYAPKKSPNVELGMRISPYLAWKF